MCGQWSAERTLKFAVDEKLDMGANRVLLVDHAKPNARILSIQIAQQAIQRFSSGLDIALTLRVID